MRAVEHVLIVGAGGHGQSVADVLLYLQEQGRPVRPIGFVDDDPALHGRQILGLPVLGPTAAVREVPHDCLMMGIGRNAVRKRHYDALCAAGERFTTVVHPTVVLSRAVVVGPGTYVGATAVVSVETVIGANAIVNGTGCVGHHNRIGDHVHLGPGVNMAGGITIGEGTMVGVGANIVPGVRIGAWCMIGAGALVRADVPDGMTVVGVPAHPLIRSDT
jgi:sugar O-acyltransferase (sialic acid O-acetyltransferase NeuD family)